MNRLKCLMKNLGGKRILVEADRYLVQRAESEGRKAYCVKRFVKIITSYLPNFISSILLFTSYFLLLTFNFAHAGGKVYWTPDGVLLPSSWGVLANPIVDTKGGAIILNAGLVDVWECLRAIYIDRNGNLPWGLDGKIIDTIGLAYVGGINDGREGGIIVWGFLGGELYYQRIDSTGTEVWGADPNVTLSDSFQGYTAITGDGSDGVIITWEEEWIEPDIYAQRIDSSGVRQWGDCGIAVCTTGSYQMRPAITCDNTGNSIIVWCDYRNGNADLFAQRLNINGLPLWQPNGVAVCDDESAQYINLNSVVMATDTTIIFCWSDLRNGNQDIYSQCFHINGFSMWIAQGVSVCDTVSSQSNGQVIADGKGGAIFCWIDERMGYKNIYAQRLNSNGEKLWTNQGIPICVADSCESQRIVSDDNFGAIICWQDNRSGNWDIYAQHIDSLGNALWDTNGMAVCTAVNTQRYPRMSASDSHTVIIGWTDRRGGQWRGYAQKVGDEVSAVGEVRSKKLEVRSIVLEFVPNPFSTQISIRYRIEDIKSQNQKAESQKISLKIYNCVGQFVKVFDLTDYQLSFNQIIWDGTDEQGRFVPSGVYFLKLDGGDFFATKKMVVLR